MAKRPTLKARDSRDLSLPSRPLNGRTPQNVGRSTISVARAKVNLLDELRPISLSSQAPARQTSRATLETPSASAVKASPRKATPDVPRAESLRMDKSPRSCKTRPSRSTGNGSGRKFIPWCG